MEENEQNPWTKEQKANRKLISKLVREYNAYKKRNLLNVRFSSNARSTMFGEFQSLVFIHSKSEDSGIENPAKKMNFPQICPKMP